MDHSEKVLVMRVFIAVLFLIFSFQSWTKASDISDFEIEGMSIGDKIFQFIKKSDIIDNGNYNPDSKFFEVEYRGMLSVYDHLTLHIIRNDPSYLIHAIRGINIVENKNKCLNLKKKIVKEMKKVFADKEFYEGSQNHYYYKDSMQYVSQFYLGKKNTIKSDLARVECVIMGKKDIEKNKNIPNTLEVIIYTEEFALWLESL